MGRAVAVTSNTDIVDQDVDPSPARLGLGDDRCAVRVARNVCLKRRGTPTLFGDHRCRFCRALQIAIDAQNLRAMAGEQHRHGPTIADGFASGLARADNNCDLALQTPVHLKILVDQDPEPGLRLAERRSY